MLAPSMLCCGPGTNEITPWWGCQVFTHMAARVVQKLATTWKKQGILYWFRGSLAQVRCGVVYGDGNNQTQLQPRNAFIQDHQQWWPVLFVPCDGMQLAVYCQDQALSNSKPWRTHPERVVLLRAATQQLLSDQTAIPRPPATAPPAARTRRRHLCAAIGRWTWCAAARFRYLRHPSTF